MLTLTAMQALSKEQRGKFDELEQIASRFFEQADVDSLRTEGIKVDLYFDTYYMLAMIQGYWELKTSVYTSIDQDIFKSDRFLVQCLAYFGYLKNIKILLPYASELYNHIEKTYLLPSDTLSKEDIDEFLQSVELSNLSELAKINHEKQLGAYLQKLAPRAVDIFKANYILSQLIWTRRFNHLFNAKYPIVRYDDTTYSTDKIIASPLFHQIFNALSSGERARKTVNNLRDAVSLCMIKQKIEDFKNGKGVLPILYLTSDVLSKMNRELKAEFVVTHGKIKINVLKDTEYFVIDAIFSASNNSIYEKEEVFFEKFRKIKETFDVYKAIGERFPLDEVNSLVSRWHQYKNHDFFEKIWHDERAGKVKLNENILDLLQYDTLVKNDETFKHIIQKDKEKIKAGIVEQVSDLVLLEEIWKEVDTFSTFLNRSINTESIIIQNEQADVFRDGGLTRFSPPGGEVEAQIKDLWNGFLEHRQSEGKDYYLKLRVSLTKSLYEGCLKSEKKNYDKIMIGLCILWMFRKYTLIIKLVEKLDNEFGDRYQIPLIYMASILRLNYKHDSQLKKIDNMIRCVESKSCYNNNYKAWLGLGYLKFNVWSCFSNAPMIPEESPIQPIKRYDRYCIDGIEVTKKTFQHLNKIKDDDELKAIYRNVKYFYSLNNYVYYIVRSSPFALFDKDTFHNYVIELENIQDDDRFRQGRFSDTIAHYYYRRAFTTSSADSKLNYLESAKLHIQKAIDLSVVVDEKFNTMKNKIQVYKDSILNMEKHEL